MNGKKVLILGASRYYSKSIEAAQRAGYFVIAVDREPDSYSFKIADDFAVCDIVDKEGVLKIAEDNQVSGIIPINDYGVPTAAYVSTRLGLPGISEESAYLATSKGAMRKRWIERGVRCPQVISAVSREECLKAIQIVGLPCILKPANGYGGASRGVIVIKEESEIDEAITFSQKFYEDKTILIETYVESILEHSAEVLIVNGEYRVIAISDKIKSPLPFRVDKNVLYPSVVTGEQLTALKNAIIESVKTLDIHVGAAHVEIASTANGPVLFELGARCGGGGTPAPILPYISGVEYFAEIVRILCGDEPLNITPDRNLACNYHFITPDAGKIKEIKGLDEINKLEGILDFEFYKKEGDNIVPVTIGTERSGFIIVGAETRDQAYQIGCEAEKMIEIKYEDSI